VVGKDNLSFFLLKLKNVKKYLKGWGINLRGSPSKRKKERNPSSTTRSGNIRRIKKI
jgi:hypothetical protein